MSFPNTHGKPNPSQVNEAQAGLVGIINTLDIQVVCLASM